MKHLLFWLWQWTWGFPQTLLGFIVYLCNLHKPHEVFEGCIVTHWDQRGSLGVGMFLFLDRHADRDTLIHEYGHSVQSMLLGPLFLPIMGIPSFLWCNLPPCRRLRKERGISYYRFYPESTANKLGSWATGEACGLQ